MSTHSPEDVADMTKEDYKRMIGDPIPNVTLGLQSQDFLVVERQQLMGSLTNERDSLLNAIQACREFFNHTRTLCATLEDEVRGIEAEEQKLRLELGKFGIEESSIMTLSCAKKVLDKKLSDQEWNLTAVRRKCNLLPAPNDPQVIGKIGHLAAIQDVETARVLSWHMASDMDCVVTRTLHKAEDIYKWMRGDQQVISLESLSNKKDLMDSWKKPLPHTKIPGHFEPTGEPVYARDLLIFPPEVSDECKIVFGLFLGDAVLINTLEDGNKYREEVEKYTSCPTILTRNCKRIDRNGKFGGKRNCAPPLSQMNVVFGEPNNTAIDLLEKLCSILDRKAEGKDNLEKYEMQKNGPEMQARMIECRAKEAELKEIEKQLGACSTPSAHILHSTSSVDERILPRQINSPTHSHEERSSRSRRQDGQPSSFNLDTRAVSEVSSSGVNTLTGTSRIDVDASSSAVVNTSRDVDASRYYLPSSSRNSSLDNGRNLYSGAWDDSPQHKRLRT